MASTPASRKQIFIEHYQRLDPQEVTYLYNLGQKPTAALVSDLLRKTRDPKLSSSIGATKVDTLVIQLLSWLEEEGVNLRDFGFDEEGRITDFPDLKNAVARSRRSN